MSAPAAVALERVHAGARRRAWRTGAAVLGLLVLAFLAAVSLGEYPIRPGELLPSLVGVGPARVTFVVERLRLPRALAGLAVGACLGLAGAVFQRVLRNPLASPDVVGVSAGAGTAAVVAITVGADGLAVSGGAAAGAALTAALVVVLARQGSVVHPVRFALVGVGMSSALLAVTSWILTSASLTTAEQTLHWLTGSLGAVTWSTAGPLVVLAGVLVPVTLVAGRALPRLELGDDLAAALGLRAGRARFLLLAAAVLLVATAVAAAGPVSFVALLAGPVAARIAGPGRTSLPHAAGVGAVLVLVGDLVARHLPVTLPVGVVTGAVGAPYLLWLLARSRERGTT